MLKALVNERRNDWDQYLPFVSLAYRTAVHEATGLTPCQMFLGREINLGLDLMVGLNEPLEQQYTCEVDFVEWQRQVFQRSFQYANEHLDAAARRQKSQYDSRTKPFKYVVGQYVWRFYPPAGIGKLAKGWIGPFRIVGRPSDVNFTIKQHPD